MQKDRGATRRQDVGGIRAGQRDDILLHDSCERGSTNLKKIDKPINVLIIEDDPGDLRLIREMLSEANGHSFKIEHRERLSSGLERLAEGGIDTVLVDLGLPDSQGLETFMSVRDQAPEVPIIVLTGFDDTAVANMAVRDGAQDYLAKDQVDSNSLARSLRHSIDRKEAQARITHLNSVLRAIRDINQLIVVEKDRDRLIKRACDILLETRGYEAVWFGLMRDAGNFAAVVGSGFGDGVSGFCEEVMAGNHPPCLRKALARADRGGMITGISMACEECFFKSGCDGRDALIVRSEHDSRLFGLLAISLAPGVASDNDEKELLKEAASDIALALHGMETADAHRAAEAALRQSEENYRTIFDAANDAIFVHHIENGDIIDSNQKMCEMCGCTREGARHLSVSDFSAGKPPYTQKDAMQWIRKASKGPQLFEWMAKDVSGKLFWTEVNLKRVVIEGEDRLIAIMRDISGRKTAEEELARYREHLEELVNIRTTELTQANEQLQQEIVERKHIEDVIRESQSQYKNLYSMVRLMCDNLPDLIWAKDAGGRFIFTNKAICERLLNASDTDEPIGKTDTYFARRETEAHPDDPEWYTFGDACTNSDSVIIKSKKPGRFEESGNVQGKFAIFD
ncbi:MAG: PAS domain S-box protein, partial [Methanosarcinales archaeon]